MNLDFTGYFITPVYATLIPEWVNPLIKATNPFIKKSKNNNNKIIKKRNKEYKKDIGDLGMSHHSNSLINIKEFKELQDFVNKSSISILDHMGYDLNNYEVHWTEFWVQEFAKNGGGHHEGHIHYDNHISGFYFLKCSDKTSMPVFHDPRPTKLMTQLPLKNESEVTFGSQFINYKPVPGTLILFPAFLEHQFVVDHGIEPFRFIHFNLQAVRKMILNQVRL
jgi:uncharacterized protein (TIGR02466 family)